MKYLQLFLYGFILLNSCSTRKPKGTFEAQIRPATPDYQKAMSWAALPEKTDAADGWAGNIKPDYVGDEVDVFFLGPTIYTGSKRYQNQWNAPIDMERFNKQYDGAAIKYQASIFNGVGKIYAPRYRQAHLNAYFNKDTASAKKAFALAYSDVKAAFDYYMKHYNNGRPIIIASHSQGTTHALYLLQEYFDHNTTMRNKLVAAYIIGIPIDKKALKNIPLCSSADQTGCYCAWRAYERGYEPIRFVKGDHIANVNPLTWTTDSNYAPASLNKGAIYRNFEKVSIGKNDAQIHNGLLWTNKPKFPGSFLMRTHNFHAGDFNIFYFNVRENAKHRIGLYWK